MPLPDDMPTEHPHVKVQRQMSTHFLSKKCGAKVYYMRSPTILDLNKIKNFFTLNLPFRYFLYML